MASRALVAHQYSFRGSRRADLDPVAIPRTAFGARAAVRSLAAVMFGTVITALTYAAYHAEPATLAETPVLPLTSDWQPDTATADQARITNLLQGPALAVPDRGHAAAGGACFADAPQQQSERHEAVIDDSAPGVQEHLPGASPAWPDSSPRPARRPSLTPIRRPRLQT